MSELDHETNTEFEVLPKGIQLCRQPLPGDAAASMGLKGQFRVVGVAVAQAPQPIHK